MLSKSDNELITRTGPGTAMGELFRRFWVPALLSIELPAPDSPPVAFGLLGEDLVAFRESSGKAGILEARCPHRHASLFWGRNEEGGLRCAYHGWKFGLDGQCLDQPAEPEGSRFKEKVRAVAYETHEAGGIVWVYMGPRELKPQFPEFEWTLLADDQFLVTKRLQLCNYLQNLEGEIDTSHANFLHRMLDSADEPMQPPSFIAKKQFLISETDFGLVAMARSEFPNDEYYWRMTPFVLPSFTLIPTPADAVNTFTGVVPIDDHNAWGFTATWRHDRPLNEREIAQVVDGGGVHLHVDQTTWLPLANKTNNYLIDRELQATSSYTGIYGVRNQDLAVQENQDGTICRRDEEHLGVNDRGIIAARRLLLRLAKDLQQGTEPRHVKNARAFRVRSTTPTAARSLDPVELFLRDQPESVQAEAVGSAY